MKYHQILGIVDDTIAISVKFPYKVKKGLWSAGTLNPCLSQCDHLLELGSLAMDRKDLLVRQRNA